MSKSVYTIGVVGLWHLGSVYSACLSELGSKVIGFDSNEKVTTDLQNGNPPLHEKGLGELIQKNIASGQLVYTSSARKLGECDILWCTLDTPIDHDGRPDIQPIKELLLTIFPYIKKNIDLIFSSQLPIGSKDEISRELHAHYPDTTFTYIYQPENLQLGAALESFFKPSRVIIGCDDSNKAESVKNILSPLNTEICVIDVASAEMTKHALNAFLGTSLSFIYDIADLCDAYGADVTAVTEALRLDPRIGRGAYLDASVGFSGGTLDRDLAVLIDKAREKNREIPVIASVASKNKERFKIVEEYLQKKLGNLSDKTIGILGLTYKPGTSTLRHSLSLKLMKDLKSQVKSIRCSDPLIKGMESELDTAYEFFSDPYEMSKGCHAIILMTTSPEYKTLDFKSIADNMNEPKFFLDGKNFLVAQEKEISSTGMYYYGIGRGNKII